MSAGSRRYDDRHKGLMFLLVLLGSAGAWFWAANRTYTLPRDQMAKALYYAAISTPHTPLLWVPTLLAFVYGMIVFAVFATYFRSGFEGADFSVFLRGARMVSPAQLRDMTRSWFPFGTAQLKFGGIPVPKKVEGQHYSVTGSTGTGKSQAIAEYIESALERGRRRWYRPWAKPERIVCVDPNGGFMSRFYRPGDKIINPFDDRSVSWGIYNEIRVPFDVELFSVSIIPKSPSTEQEVWNAMARTITSEVMLKLWRLGRGTTDHLVYWLTMAPNDMLQEMLADTAAAGMFHGAEETLGSVRTVLTRYITPHKFLSAIETAQKEFSFRDWLDEGTGNVWITWREDQLSALKPLISCQFDVLCAAALSAPPNRKRPATHLVADELDSLEKLNYVVEAATKGRKHKFYIMAGFQSYAQLDDTNGKQAALTLRNSFRNTLSLGISDMDTYTASEISKGLGEHEVIRKRDTGGKNPTTTYEKEREPLVMPSEIHNLPDLTGYLKLAGKHPIARVTMQYKERRKVIEPIVMAKNAWTTAPDLDSVSTLNFQREE
ncbi:type IV secretion system DNA-binding domain-containing protein [Burkholderia multivorans]|uniref:type IV secretion system DNA-binding domain-containing protein n=1 Tax=Burkholderia multivorans TaxID=87883 RepID=UPI0009B88BAA|nr:type IV secretion system DNA-binding domain-containing protein [Burkholderia multivorans]MDR9230061.1 Coupling protein TraD [Burkholderia multivorans]HDR9474427.1 type IV secretion system DNA-binding domain-containing protein [Burkholderia multivorans]HDR9480269.1 type IV secretion system DNA-binding domain-containing protein [Burkholderia multivorans]